MFESHYARLPEDQKKAFGSAKDFATAVVDRHVAMTAADRSLMTYDPKPTLQKVRCPVLALFGEKDPKVSLAANRERLLQSLPKDGDHTAMLIPGAHHAFQDVTGAPTAQFVPGFPDIVSGWILTRVSRGSPRTRSQPRP